MLTRVSSTKVVGVIHRLIIRLAVEGGATQLDGNAIAKLLAAAQNSTEFTVVTTTTTQTKIVTNGNAAPVAPAAGQGKVIEEGTDAGKAAEQGKPVEGGQVGVEELITAPQAAANAVS